MRGNFTEWVLISAALAGRAFGQAPPDPAGDWQGTLKVGGAELRLVLHISKTSSGDWKGALDSIDQPGSNGIPITLISAAGTKLSFSAASVHGSYEGKFHSDGTAIDGTWTQSQPTPLVFTRIKNEFKPVTTSDIDGAWLGTLDTGALKLRLVFHIAGLTATMDSPDEGANGIPVTTVTRSGSSLTLELKQMGGEFEGKISSDLKVLEGTWSQGGVSLPLVLKHKNNTAEMERRRPQNPVPPYPYRAEDVEYPNSVADIKLAGTLSIPSGSGPFPAVLLITGSGPQDRDETLLGHKPFLVLSDSLTRKGIEVLRADDRGVGKSGGSFSKSTTADFATDAEAGVAYLKTRSEINPHKIGLIGHSEGAVIAPMVAARNSDVAFIVMMAGSGVPGDEIIAEQVRLIGEASGETHQAALKNDAEERELLGLVKQGKPLPDTLPDGQVKQLTSPWFRYFLAYDPVLALRKVRCPVLVLNGEKDLQVSPKQNLPAIRKALEEGGNKNVEVDELSGLNHLFQTAKTGLPGEYAEIEETIAPIALDKIVSWILTQ